MAWQQADLTAIEQAISTGAKRVRFQTHEVEYPSPKEMLLVRDRIKQELDQSLSSGGGAIYAEYGSDY